MSKNAIRSFKESWESEISKIEKQPIDSRGTVRIFLNFKKDMLFLEMYNKRELTPDLYMELHTLESKLRTALETARSNFRLQNRDLWARIVEGIGRIIYRIPQK